MTPTRWVLPRALSLSLLAVMMVAGTASAQFYGPAVNALDLAGGPAARSPRLLGMGDLTIAVPDRSNQTRLWDFAGIPVGLVTDDSTSTIDLRPGTHSLSSVRGLNGGIDRQNLAARGTSAQTEAVYRSDKGGMFAVVGDLSSLRWDSPYSNDVERRQGLHHPEVMAILSSRMPRFLGFMDRWAAHLRFRDEVVQDQFRTIVSNAAGEWIGLGGDQLPPPTEFDPTETRVNTTAYGLSVERRFGPAATLAIGAEHEGNRYKALNVQPRSTAEYTEDRPFWNLQGTLVGKVGGDLEYGLDGIQRFSSSERFWRFTTSAGVGGIALTGRGRMLYRSERAREAQARVRWTPGRAVVAASVRSVFNESYVEPPNANAPGSLNEFINIAFNRPGADSLALPDSVGFANDQRNAVFTTLGTSYRFGSTTVGAEYHWARDDYGHSASGSGPRRVAWDVRVGVERPIAQRLTGRVGYVMRKVDLDDHLTGNEYKANAYAVGLGYTPAGTSWTVETGYLIEFRDQDFGDPTNEHQSRQNLAMHLRWAF